MKTSDQKPTEWSLSEWKDEMTEKPRVDREGHPYMWKEMDAYDRCSALLVMHGKADAMGSLADWYIKASRDEVWFDCCGRNFLVNGCQCEFDQLGRTVKSTLELYELDASGNVAEVLYRAVADSPNSCVRAFVREARISEKPFVDMRKFIRWRK